MQLNSNHIEILVLLLVLLLGALLEAAEGDDGKKETSDFYYTMPNPFKDPKDYYYIKSVQTFISSSKKRVQLQVEDYFSLRGFSLSLHVDRDTKPPTSYALIADGPEGRSYIARDFNSPDDFTCELDHIHQQHRVFPWQYVFDVEDPNDGDDVAPRRRSSRFKTSTNNRWAKKRYIYGVGAIWLNAIDRKIVSNQVAGNSPYPGSNCWEFKDHDLKVKLLFDRPQDGSIEESAGDGPKMQEVVNEHGSLGSIHVDRYHSIGHDNEQGDASLWEVDYEDIIIKEFVAREVKFMPLLRMLLSKCRTKTQNHRVFPNLMRSLSLSPYRLYNIDYIEKTYPRMMKYDLQTFDKINFFDDKFEHRYIRTTEFKSEWFSFKKETQVHIYQPLPSKDTFDDDQLPAEYQDVTDVFIKKFTENQKKDQSSHHSTVNYHMVERNGQVESCKVGQHEQKPKDHLLSRPIHFTRSNGVKLTARLTGLGALIMNAADVHYEQFNLLRRKIFVDFDPHDPKARMEVEADVWELYDHKTDRTIKFYFKRLENRYDQHEIEDLIRIDIHDAKYKDMSDDIITLGSEDDGEDADMLMRYDIVAFSLQATENDVNFLFTPAAICYKDQQPADSDDSDDDDMYHDDDFFNNFTDSDDDDSEHGGHDADDGGEHIQQEGEEFEFVPGKMVESVQTFPDFYEFLDGSPSYSIISKLQLLDDDNKPSKHIHLMENVDLETEMARYLIYFSDEALALAKPDLEYYINYNSELLFALSNNRQDCKVVEDVEPWLRILSAPIKYYKLPKLPNKDKTSAGADEVVVESSSIPLYGVGALWRNAAESGYTQFLGIDKNVVIGPEDKKYKRVRWTMTDDPDMDLTFQFLLDLSKSDKNEKLHHHHLGRAYELLRLDSIFVSNIATRHSSNEDISKSKFQKFKISTPSVFGTVEAKEHINTLPESCKPILAKELVRREEEVEDLIEKNQLPKFQDFVGPSGRYTLSYTITYYNGQSKLAAPVSSQPIVEYYDRKNDRGMIQLRDVSDGAIQQIYIDGGKKAIYSYMMESKVCKRINSIESLLADYGATFVVKNDQFDKKKLYGLAALWIRISELQGFKLKISYRHDHRGNFLKVKTYEYSSGQSGEMADFKIVVTFAQRPRSLLTDDINSTWFPGIMRSREELEFELEKIEFLPESYIVDPNLSSMEPKAQKTPTNLHRTIINVYASLPEIAQEWKIPVECEALPSGGGRSGGSDQIDSSHFPKLMNLVKANNQFYMRSELTSSVPMFGSEKRIYMMDEWLYHKNIRVKTYGLKNNLDLLIYAETKELFDLSNPYRCPNVPPKLQQSKPRTESKIIEFWSTNDAVVSNLLDLYYGPVALWYLAEKNLAQVKLANKVDLAPKDISKRTDNFLKREMRMETWRVESVPGSTKQPWSYEMTFEKMSSLGADGSTQEWHVLDKIQFWDTEYLGVKRHGEIDVINYRYNQNNDEMIKNFLIPEGYDCKRSQLVRDPESRYNDELHLNVQNEHSLWYEASLELLDLNMTPDDDKAANDDEKYEDLIPVNFKQKRMLPTILGTLTRSANSIIEPNLDVYSNFVKIRYPNGTLAATRTIFDNFNLLIWQMDQITGTCEQGKAPKKIDWSLEFPVVVDGALDQRYETIQLGQILFEQLFLDTNRLGFQPLNWYKYNGLYISTYEKSLDLNHVDDLKLSSSFLGPITIIRKFQHYEHSMPPMKVGDFGMSTKLHDSVYVKVLLFDGSRSKVLAVLRINLGKTGNAELKHVLKATNVYQCYNDGDPNWDRELRSYMIEYYIKYQSIVWAEFNVDSIEQEFFKILMLQERLLFNQLDGSIRTEFDSQNSGFMRIYFNVIEGPTSIEYFHGNQGFSMDEKLEMKAEIRLASTITECSKWCDSIESCVALSFCVDRTCKIITSTMLSSGAKKYPTAKNQQILSADDIRELSDARVENPECSYFYRTKAKVKTLDNFALNLDEVINQSKEDKDLSKLALLIEGQKVVPSSFKEIKSSFRSTQEDEKDVGDSEIAISQETSQATNSIYTILKRNSKLSVWDISEFLKSNKLTDYGAELKSITDQSHKGYSGCLNSCKLSNCLLMSYCKQDSNCIVVSGQKVDLKRILELPQQEQANCIISVRDQLNDYTQFRDTQLPAKFNEKLENYSPIECAAACNLADGQQSGNIENDFNCLSFDYCLQTDNGQRESNVCYLQSSHLMRDDFDRAILSPKWHVERNLTNESREGYCDHYSKSILADFYKIPNKKFLKKKTTLLKVTRGLNNEKCAMQCQEEDNCKAFEYCVNSKLQPLQACYFIKADEKQPQQQITSSKELESFVKEELKYSKKCNVYLMRHPPEQYSIEAKSNLVQLLDATQRLFAKHGSFLTQIFTKLGYILVAITVGLLIQLVYIKMMGQPLIYQD